MKLRKLTLNLDQLMQAGHFDATRKHFTQRTKQRKMIQTWSRRSRRFNIKWDMPRGRLYPQGGGNANTEPPTYMWRAGLDQTYACWRRNQGSTSSGVAVV
jgi:hypothetical protein